MNYYGSRVKMGSNNKNAVACLFNNWEWNKRGREIKSAIESEEKKKENYNGGEMKQKSIKIFPHNESIPRSSCRLKCVSYWIRLKSSEQQPATTKCWNITHFIDRQISMRRCMRWNCVRVQFPCDDQFGVTHRHKWLTIARLCLFI